MQRIRELLKQMLGHLSLQLLIYKQKTINMSFAKLKEGRKSYFCGLWLTNAWCCSTKCIWYPRDMVTRTSATSGANEDAKRNDGCTTLYGPVAEGDIRMVKVFVVLGLGHY